MMAVVKKKMGLKSTVERSGFIESKKKAVKKFFGKETEHDTVMNKVRESLQKHAIPKDSLLDHIDNHVPFKKSGHTR